MKKTFCSLKFHMFRLNWETLTAEDADVVKARLNASLASAQPPNAIGDILITHLDFGSVAPKVQITGIGPVNSVLEQSIQELEEVEQTERKDADRDHDNPSESRSRPAAFALEATQISVNIQYNGNASIELRTCLSTDWEQMGISKVAQFPLQLYVTDLHIQGEFHIIYKDGSVYVTCNAQDELLKQMTLRSILGDTSLMGSPDTRELDQFVVKVLRKIVNDKLLFPRVFRVYPELKQHVCSSVGATPS